MEAISAEMQELRTLTDGLYRARTEEGKALREAELANRQVQQLASENAALAGHNNTKQKIKHLQVNRCCLGRPTEKYYHLALFRLVLRVLRVFN